MELKLYKFSGAGNDFVVIDGREGGVDAFREVPRIEALCKEYTTDGLMILGEGDAGVDFTMEFFNPDGSGGMMCGNGGRCIVAFADYLGIRPACHPKLADGSYLFRAPDGLHTGEILARSEGNLWSVRLKMIDVKGITPMLGGYFLNTGTRHFVKFVPDVEQVDVASEGKALRWAPAFAPIGTNVNFVHVAPDGLHVRTFEKGVEGETLACGTGLMASAIAAFYSDSFVGQRSPLNDNPLSTGGAESASLVVPGDRPVVPDDCPVVPGDCSVVLGDRPIIPSDCPVVPDDRPVVQGDAKESVRLRARQDWLSVDFTPGPDNTFTDVYLTGPARLVLVAPEARL